METMTSLLIVVLCLLLSAFFSGSETALLQIGEHQLEQDISAARGPAALAVRDLLRSTSQLLITILMGNNLVNITGASVAAALGARLLGEEWGVFGAATIMTVLVFVFGEVLPKAVAAEHPRRVAYIVALPLYLLHKALRPLHVAYARLIAPLIASIAHGGEATPMSSAEEIMRLARSVATDEAKGTPLAIIGATAGAAELTVSDIMVPRSEIVAFPIETTPSALLDQMLAESYTRAPIYEGSIDRVIGVAHLKDLVELVGANGTSLRRTLKSVLQVPERKPILRLLADMQRAFVHLAIVTDEFGVTQGLVTQEDILEELVGEIRDEFDRDELSTIRKLSAAEYQAVGRVKVTDFNRQTGWKLEAERGDTLAGLIFNLLGRTPRKGETVKLSGYELVVLDLSGSRVTQVRIIQQCDPAAQP